MNLPLVSICVPIYNVAPYIERCVRSLMEQTYSNIEFVFVDDCSTDDSIAILDRVLADYFSRNENVKVVHNDRNHGLAYTRRVSIENAKGEYITCVDSDDYVELNMVQCLVDKAYETNADIVSAGYFYEENHSISTILPSPSDNEKDYIYVTLTGQIHHICSKLFRRSLFTEGRNCYAPDGMDYLEDRLMILLLGTKIRRIATINKPLYHYIYRSNSISQGKNEKHLLCLIRFWQEADKLLEELGVAEKYKLTVGKLKIEDKANLLMHSDNKTRKEFVDLFQKEEQLYKPELSRGVGLMYWLTKHHLWLLTSCYQYYIRFLDYRKASK